jgi:hypothetical protein
MEFTDFNYDSFSESDCYCSITGVDFNYKEFISIFGEARFDWLKDQFAHAGMPLRGYLGDSAIFDLPTPLRDCLRDEIDEILYNEIFMNQ